MPTFLEFLAGRQEREAEYAIYPKDLTSPYRDSRFKVGEDMYALLGIGRDNKPARLAHLARNFSFFDACRFFLFCRQTNGAPSVVRFGMFLQTFMLLAEESGLSTCAQEAWANRPVSVAEFVGADSELMLFCGMAIGYRDDSKPVNQLVADRAPLDTWANFSNRLPRATRIDVLRLCKSAAQIGLPSNPVLNTVTNAIGRASRQASAQLGPSSVLGIQSSQLWTALHQSIS